MPVEIGQRILPGFQKELGFPPEKNIASVHEARIFSAGEHYLSVDDVTRVLVSLGVPKERVIPDIIEWSNNNVTEFPNDLLAGAAYIEYYADMELSLEHPFRADYSRKTLFQHVLGGVLGDQEKINFSTNLERKKTELVLRGDDEDDDSEEFPFDSTEFLNWYNDFVRGEDVFDITLV